MIVDGHEDLAWNIETFGRDYTRSVEATRALEAGGPTVEHNGQALLGWPDWIEGQVGLTFAVLFASPKRWQMGAWDHVIYEDSAQAHWRYWGQLDLYERLADDHPDKFQLITSQTGLATHLAAWEAKADQRKLGWLLLMEGADGVGAPQELEEWYGRGLRIVGPAWDRTRYAGSCYDPGPFTREGFALLEVMAQLGMLLDVSHLSDEAARQAVDRYPGSLLASHANVRRLVPHSRYPERHLHDDVIGGLVERDAVIGVVLANKFLKDGWQPGDPRELVTIEHVVDHIDAICQLAGDARHVALGSDFDGGFGLDQVPVGLDSIADLGKIGQALLARGYQESDMLGVLGNNWIRLLERALPPSD
jgi:membrane dipeptidase